MGHTMNQVTQAQPTITFAGFRCRFGKRSEGLPTRREAETLACLASGMTQKQIAKLRGVSPATIKSTVEAAYFRLHASRATEAVAKAMRRGWIAPLLLALIVGGLSPNQPAQRVRQPVRVVRMQRRETEVVA